MQHCSEKHHASRYQLNTTHAYRFLPPAENPQNCTAESQPPHPIHADHYKHSTPEPPKGRNRSTYHLWCPAAALQRKSSCEPDATNQTANPRSRKLGRGEGAGSSYPGLPPPPPSPPPPPPPPRPLVLVSAFPMAALGLRTEFGSSPFGFTRTDGTTRVSACGLAVRNSGLACKLIRVNYIPARGPLGRG